MDSLNELDRKNIWHPFTSLEAEEDPILIERGEGIYLHSHDGRKIIDAVSSWWVNLHGHGHPVIAKAVAMQAQKLEHVIFAGFTHEPAIHLSKNLLSILPQNQIKVFFSDNGSTAVEVALKMAFQFWHNQGISHKKKVVAMRGAYHGDTFGSMSVGERGLFTAPFSSYLFDVEYIDFPTSNNEEAVIDQFKNLLNTEEGAAVVCIADEVFTGFGRTGKMFASNYLANEPDIVAVSKGITGGTMALAVTSCCEKIVSAFRSIDKEKTFFHGHSYTANPIACAAGNASFELLMDESCQRQIKMIEQQHLRFKQKFNGFRNLEEVRCLGTILALELKTHEKTSYFNEIRRKILPYFLSKNILLRPLGNVIYIVPPYVIQEHELTQIYSCIENFLLE